MWPRQITWSEFPSSHFQNDKTGWDDSSNKNNKIESCYYIVLKYITWIMSLNPYNDIILLSSFYRRERGHTISKTDSRSLTKTALTSAWLNFRQAELPDSRSWPLFLCSFGIMDIFLEVLSVLEPRSVFLKDLGAILLKCSHQGRQCPISQSLLAGRGLTPDEPQFANTDSLITEKHTWKLRKKLNVLDTLTDQPPPSIPQSFSTAHPSP